MSATENTASIALDMALSGERYREVYEHFTKQTCTGAHDAFVFGVAKAGERVAEWENATGKDFDLIETSAEVAAALLTAWGDTDFHNPEDTNDVDSIVDTVLGWDHT